MRLHREGPGRRAGALARGLRALLTAGCVLGMAAGVLAPAAAEAAARTPLKPVGVHVAATASTSFTVVAAPSRYARGYRLFTSSRRGYLALATIGRMRRTVVVSRPRVTMAGLAYTSAPIYYRLQAVNGSRVRYSDVQVAYLRPDAPTGLRATGRAATGLALSWGGRAAGRYVVTQASNAALTVGVRRYSITSRARTFTPYDLRRGARYWFQVRAYGGSTASAPSNVVSAVAPSSGQTVRVMTYNLLRALRDGQRVGSERVAPWTRRRAAAVALITMANPDVLGLQEASDWAGAVRGPRMADDVRAHLGGRYSLAHTEIAPGERNWFRTGRYILYKNATYRAVGAGGHWTLAAGRFAAYQVLQNRVSGARFLAVSVHLEAGHGRTVDLRRQAQTQRLLRDVRAFRATHDVPVIYVGDFNSHERNVVDGPGNVFRAAGHVDADEVAQVLVNHRYNSANQYARTAPARALDVDHVYAPPGVAVRRWQMVLSLRGGRFVGVIPSDHNPVAADVVLPY
jgi:endonuclease/exonuclease/phosphatase family metal-dependent hydrolase